MLIVDDNHINLLALKMIVISQGQGIAVDEACDGEQGVLMVHESKRRLCCGAYRIVFMDINMPIMDGYTATQEIRKTLTKEETLVVAATAYPEKEVEQRGKEVGMDDFITKPLNPRLVSDILQRAGLKQKGQ